MTDSNQYLKFFPSWLKWAEGHWHDLDERKGFFGSGGGSALSHCGCGGYLAACIMMVSYGSDKMLAECSLSKDKMISRALAAFRYMLESHVTQKSRTISDEKWGHHWGTPIMLERAANFIRLLRPYMGKDDLNLYRTVMIDEANHYCSCQIETNRFGLENETHAERNYWRGTHLFRCAMEYPAHDNQPLWLEKANEYCVNSLSVPEDERSEIALAGRPVKDWFIGANVHSGFFFEHHGCLSLDYSIHVHAFFIMFMISVLSDEHPIPEAVFHHLGDMWDSVRRCLLPNGQIAFVGGIWRPRYTITQAYLLPVLIFWGKYGHDPAALELAGNVRKIISTDRKNSGDGSFYGCRGLGVKEKPGLYYASYYYRLEADVIFSLGMAHLLSKLPRRHVPFGPTIGKQSFVDHELHKLSVSRDVGIVSKRTSQGLFSVYWHRSDKAESDPPLAMCIPFANPHRVDWLSNLATNYKPLQSDRWLVGWDFKPLENGFATAGRYHEGRFLKSDENWGFAIEQQLAFVLFPDGKTFLRVEKAKALQKVTVSEIASLNLNLSNDIFTGSKFTLYWQDNNEVINGKVGGERFSSIESKWVNIENELGIIGLYGADNFTLQTFDRRQRVFSSLLVDRLYYPLIREFRTYQPGENILDTAIILVCNNDARLTRKTAEEMSCQRRTDSDSTLETVKLRLPELGELLVVINFSEKEKSIDGGIVNNLKPLARGDVSSSLKPWGIKIFHC